MQHFANVQTRHLIGGEGVLKMFRGRDRRSQGGVSHNDVQIFKHLEEADVDTLIDELAVLTDNAADGNVDLDKINIGCKVRLLDIEYSEELEYKIVGSTEANSLKGKISNESPVGKALIGCKIGDTVEVETAAGTFAYKVLEIQRSN